MSPIFIHYQTFKSPVKTIKLWEIIPKSTIETTFKVQKMYHLTFVFSLRNSSNLANVVLMGRDSQLLQEKRHIPLQCGSPNFLIQLSTGMLWPKDILHHFVESTMTNTVKGQGDWQSKERNVKVFNRTQGIRLLREKSYNIIIHERHMQRPRM